MSESFDSVPSDGAATSSVDSGSSAPITTQSQSSQEPISGGQQQDTINPAWEPVLKDLPEFFHTKAKQHFKQWDDNYNKLNTQYQELQGKYRPFEQYSSVDPRHLGYAMNVLQAINSDPMRVHQLLTEQLRKAGMLQDEQSTQPDNQEEQYPDEYRQLDERTRQLDERQRQFDDYIQQQQYDKQVQSFERDIDKQVQAVVQKYGDAVDVEDLLQRMFVQSQRGQNFNAEAAFNEQKAVFQRLYGRQSQNPRPAPKIIPTTGTPAPSGEKRPEEMNEDERKAYFKQLLDIANTGG